MPLHEVPDDGGAPLGPAARVLRDGTAVADGHVLGVGVDEPCEIVQRYLAGTPVLETVFVTPSGATGVTDLWWGGELLRVVVVHGGSAKVRIEGAGEDDGRRMTALRHWWEHQPAPVEEPAPQDLVLPPPADLVLAQPRRAQRRAGQRPQAREQPGWVHREPRQPAQFSV